jgi:hypothetical protein
MDYFQTIINEIEHSINIETTKMLEASNKVKEHNDRINELRKQRDTVLGLDKNISKNISKATNVKL